MWRSEASRALQQKVGIALAFGVRVRPEYRVDPDPNPNHDRDPDSDPNLNPNPNPNPNLGMFPHRDGIRFCTVPKRSSAFEPFAPPTP